MSEQQCALSVLSIPQPFPQGDSTRRCPHTATYRVVGLPVCAFHAEELRRRGFVARLIETGEPDE